MNTNTSPTASSANKALRYIIYVLLGATLFVPLIVGDGINHIGIPFASMFFPFITGKAFAFRILVELAFGIWIILACRDKNARPKISAVTVGVTIFTLVALLVDLTGVNFIRSMWSNFERMEGWVTIIHLWAYFIVFTSVMQVHTNGVHNAEKTRQLWHRFFNISFVAAFFVALWGILQLTGHLPIQQSADRLDASIGNAEYLAVYMLLNGFLALYMAVVAWGKRRASGWIYVVLAFLYFLVLWFTQTRGTTLALIFGLFAALAIFAFIKDKGHHTTDGHVVPELKSTVSLERKIAGSLVILIVLVVGGFWSIRNTHFVQSHETLARLASISVNNPRIQFIWPEAWQGFKEKPILGWGQENFNYVFNQFYNPEAWAQEQWFDRAHNVFIDWAMNGGIVGFGAYVALFILALVSVWKSDFNIKERAILTSLLIAYAIHNMFVFDNLASYIMFFIALAFLSSEWHARRKALALAHTAGGHIDTATQPGRLVRTEMKLHSFDINNDVTNWVIVPIVIVLGLWIIYFINVRAIDQNLNLISAMENCQGAGQTGAPALDPTLFTKAEQGPYLGLQEIHEQVYSCAEQVIGAQQGVTNDVKLAYYQLASDAFTTQTKMTPNDLRGYLFAGSFYNDLGQWSVALPYLTRAYQLSPVKQSVLFALAQNDINGATAAASTTDAVALLAKAYNEAPDYPQAQTSYAQGLFITKQYAAAQALLQKIITATPTDLQSTMMLAASDEYLKQPAAAIALLQVVASSSPSDAPTIAKYESQIKQGINPFISPATSAAGAAGTPAGQ